MQILTTTVARILFAVPIAVFGVLHFMNASNMAGMVPSFIPGGVFWVYLTGIALLAAAVSIIIEKQTRTACLLLAGMLGIFVLTIHVPSGNIPMILKDVGLAAGALLIAGKYE